MFDLLIFAGFVLAVVAFRRSGRSGNLHKRLAQIEKEVRELRRQVRPGMGGEAEVTSDGATTTEDPAAPITATNEPPSRPVIDEDVAPAAPHEAKPSPTTMQPAPRRPPGLLPLPPRPPAVQVDWEKWLGVRGAAVLGGVVLALAGLFFFRYSIEHGLIPPWLRVVLGMSAGIGCVAGAERYLRRNYALTANAVAGAGVVILYATAWAAHSLYALIGTPATFVLMILVTAACCALSWRHESLVIAVIGLVGGFLTPLLLASGSDRPIGLFSYVLLLDAGLLYIAQRRGWPILAVLSLIGTLLYQTAWIVTRMGPQHVLLGLVILGVFAVVFAVAGRSAPAENRTHWMLTQAGGVFFPFVFAVYFAGNGKLSPHPAPLAVLLVLLAGGASWLARVQKRPWLGMGAASASVAVLGAWILAHRLDSALALELAACCFAVALVFHLFVETDRESVGWEGPTPAALVAALAPFAFLIASAALTFHVSPWPWVAAWVGLSALLVRHGTFAEREVLQPIAAAALAAALSLLQTTHAGDRAFPALSLYLGAVLALAVAFQVVALVRRHGRARVWAEHAAALFAVLMLLSLCVLDFAHVLPPWLMLSAAAALAFLAVLAGTRLGRGGWLLAAVVAAAIVQAAWLRTHAGLRPTEALTVLLCAGATVLAFSAWPFLTAARFRRDRWGWYAAALAGPLFFLPMKGTFHVAFGDSFIGILPIALGAVSLGAAARARHLWPADDPVRKSVLVWFLAVSLSFLTVAVPLQLEKEWITIGWALEGLATILLWRRMDHPGLKYFALALFTAVTVRLIANPAVLGYYPRPAWRIVNWLLYTYLVPAAAFLRAAVVLGRDEINRGREWEAPLYAAGRPLGAGGVGLAAVVVIFVWINLAIADWFSAGPTLRVAFERMPARDLTTSIAWAVYALVLMTAGVRFANRGLRWVSLILMMLAIVKVFLHDLGQLQDLYRVASLLGLAISLIVVSLAYQRFVLGGEPPEEK